MQLAELELKNEELEKGNENLKREIEEHCGEIKSWVNDMLQISDEEYSEDVHSITDVLSKLHKVIVKNKRVTEGLQEELKEYKKKIYEPPDSPDVLSRSLGGHSWNSMEQPKELCRNCKQAKWQRVLKGSFDFVDYGMEVKHVEVEKLVEKLGLDESKNRKRHSLKDSLDLADDQLEHLQRLSRQSMTSLEVVSEESLEESDEEISGERNVVVDKHDSMLDDKPSNYLVECGDKMPNDEVEHGDEKTNGKSNSECEDKTFHDGSQGESRTDEIPVKNVSEDSTRISEESWKSIHVSPRLSHQFSILSEPGQNGLLKEAKPDSHGSAGKEKVEEISVAEENNGDWKMEVISEEEEDGDERWWEEQDSDELWLVDEDSQGYETDQDKVQVVNLYRSLVFTSDSPQPKDFVDGECCEQNGKAGDESCNDENENFDNRIAINENTSNQDEIHSHVIDQSMVSRQFSIPKIIVGKDLNDNFLEEKEQENSEVEESNFTGTSDNAHDSLPNVEFNGESSDQNGEYSDEVGKCAEESGDVAQASKDILQPDSTDENATKKQISESLSISTDQSNFAFEFMRNFGDETPLPPATCSRCTESIETIKTILTGIIANKRKEQELELFRELQETKMQLRECQSEYERLDSVCEDYRNYVDEYSGNLKRKNEELRRIKLNNSIMKTEVDWLRQALGITGMSYSEF